VPGGSRPVTISKPDFARALADRMLEALDESQDDEALGRNRPLLVGEVAAAIRAPAIC
jgi:hypothetical protein